MKTLAKNRRGFTIVELMVTVMIVGIISVVGLPVFKRMVQKSRVAEAQVALGNLATTESSFFSEYGVYGNSLANMGLDFTSYKGQALYASVASDTSSRYAYGFSKADCSGTTTPLPTAASTQGLLIGAQLPTYYYNFPCTIPPIGSAPSFCPQPSMLGRISLTKCGTTNSPSGITTPVDVYSSATGNDDSYTAVASGVIAPGVDLDNPTTLSQVDIWTINEGRVLTNIQSGIQ